MKSLCSLLILMCCSTSLQAQQATRDEFHAFCKLIEGRWIGSTVRVADSVFGKKGDKATNYFSSTMAADGNVLIGTFQSGEGTGKWIVTYDPGERMIVGMLITSGGDFERFKVVKEQGKWTQYRQGHQADGSPIERKESLTVSDDGDTHTWMGSSSTDGKPNDDHSVVWRRLYNPMANHGVTGKENVTPDQEWVRSDVESVKPPHDWEYLRGDWEFTNTKGTTAKVSFEDVAGGMASVGHWITTDGKHAHETIGWNSDKQALIVSGYGQSGIYWHVEYTQVGKSKCSGPNIVNYSDGTSVEGILTIEKINENLVKLQTIGKDQDGKDITVDAQFKRLTK